jgi:23S rRNA (cytidine1920-2'-O)/16S rRNA (cytidine1409-2'-O)-methyltransferase
VLLAELHQKAIDLVTAYALGLRLKTEGTVPSPVLGPKGNKEFLIYLHS